MDEETAENTIGANLKDKDNNEEDAICSEKHSGLFDGPTVAKEGNDEYKSSKCNENVSSLLYYCWLNKLLQVL